MKTILCIGDSITYGYGIDFKESWFYLIKNEYKEYKFINSGINGDTTVGMMNRLTSEINLHSPDIIILLGGSNDFLCNRKISDALDNIKIIIKESLEKNIIPIILSPPKMSENMAIKRWDCYCNYKNVNCIIESYEKELQNICKENSIKFVNLTKEFNEWNEDLYTDGVHLSYEGNCIVYKSLLNSLKSTL
ncbi:MULTISPECIES: GDSL-type esterase/lipase family protein [Clostridium]|uniref:Acyl-CoA thioesterase n=1 Tax=Clostridium senegalense TaxID=1465809 RepID=A0A6M0H610_9CLOT|nr:MULTISPECIES: GDSL-type esterase/lipase family protein [Clostridium]NEU05967.1 acyl-CoA thioesterase [Clostridium senegalense]